MENKLSHEIVVNVGKITLSSNSDISDENLIIEIAEDINAHIKSAQNPLFYVDFIESIDGKRITQKLKDKAFNKLQKKINACDS